MMTAIQVTNEVTPQRFQTCSRKDAVQRCFDRPFVVVSMRDPDCEPARFRGEPVAQLDLAFHDAEKDSGLPLATREDAARIVEFWKAHQHIPLFVAQCDAGAGRSQAVMAGLLECCGDEGTARELRKHGTYNRHLYRLMVGGIQEPAVSIVVRVKYPPDRLRAFILSMQRQRYENWELIIVTDGPNPEVVDMCFGMPGVRVIQTPQAKGRWGHPWRQLGIDAAKGEYVGLANDDNYLAPGFIEQLSFALEDGADLALCDYAGKYLGWDVVPATTDAGFPDVNSWLARTSFIKQIRWEGAEYDSDGKYVSRLAEAGRVAYVNRILMVKN